VLRTVFIGSRNEFDELLVGWLARRTDLRGVVWTSSTEWQRTLRGKLEFARRRARRHGMVKAVDEAAFYLVFHRLLKRRDDEALRAQVIAPNEAPDGKPHWRGDAITASNVNEPHVLHFLREHRPDLALAVCITNYFHEEIRSIPRHGVFLWHEGFTPEYKGLYSPFWAAHNLDFERIGYTLLRMNDEYDAGQVFAQGRALDVDPLRHGHLYMGHKAIWDSLPDVERLFGELERGEASAIDRSGAKTGMYTYPGLSDLIRQRVRFRRIARGGSGTATATYRTGAS
jgi:methionyl-tRNA formyltransferase